MVNSDGNSMQRIDMYTRVGAEGSEGVQLPRLLLARLVWLLHACVSFLIVVGWALPWHWAPRAVFFVASAALFSWRVNNDRCPLTVLEEHLRGHTPPSADEKEPANCVVDSLSRLLRRPLPYDLVNRGIRYVTWVSLSIALLELALGEG